MSKLYMSLQNVLHSAEFKLRTEHFMFQVLELEDAGCAWTLFDLSTAKRKIDFLVMDEEPAAASLRTSEYATLCAALPDNISAGLARCVKPDSCAGWVEKKLASSAARWEYTGGDGSYTEFRTSAGGWSDADFDLFSRFIRVMAEHCSDIKSVRDARREKRQSSSSEESASKKLKHDPALYFDPAKLRHNVERMTGVAHAHERDKYIFFDDSVDERTGQRRHDYYINGVKEGVVSGTGFVHAFFPPFDKNKVIRGILTSYNLRSNRHYSVAIDGIKKQMLRNLGDRELHSIDIDEEAERVLFDPGFVGSKWYEAARSAISDFWIKAADDGTDTHDNVECYLNHDEYEWESREFKHFLAFQADYPFWMPWRTEQRIYCKKAKLCGSVDALYKDLRTGNFVVVDWKRSYEIRFAGYCQCKGEHEDNCGGVGSHPLTRDMPACNASQYFFQVNLYRWIYERHYGLKIDDCYLVILHPRQSKYIIHKAPNLQDKISAAVAERKLAVADNPLPRYPLPSS